MAKDKKKKKAKKAGKKPAGAGKAVESLKSLSQNPLVADVIAAALVATAAALKDSKKARQLASAAGDELEMLAREGAERGNAMWQLALEVGRRAIHTLGGEDSVKPKAASKTKVTAPKTKAR